MRKIFGLLMIGIGLFSCKPQAYEVKGFIKGVNNGYILAIGETINDTIPLVNGLFEFKGSVQKNEIVKFYIEDDENKVETYLAPIKLFISNDVINIKGQLEQYGRISYKINGGREHQIYESYNSKLGILDSIKQTYFNTQTLLMNGEFEEIKELQIKNRKWCAQIASAINQIPEWNHKISSTFILLDNLNYIPLELANTIANNFSPEMQSSPYLIKAKKKLVSRGRMQNGKKIPDFKLKDKSGNVYSLDNFKGKYLLMDFGGYYCHWCVKEFPNAVKACSKYKDEGMVLLSINMDGNEKMAEKDHERQSRYLEKYKVDLNKYYLSPCGRVNDLVAKYNIDGYPYIILVGPDGEIIEKNLRGKHMAMVVDNCFD